MARIAFDPEVPVFDRHAKSFPKHAEGEPATYGKFSEACTTAFKWDAHLAAYSCPAIGRRLGTAGAHAYKPKMVLWIVDIDGPDHQRTPAWDEEIKAKLAAFAKKYGRGYAFATRGGVRLVMGLRDEFVIDSAQAAMRWRLSYLAWLDQLRAEFGIVGDPACADWTRCYRLPRVRRDGVDVAPDFEIGEPDRMLEWRGEYVAVDDPRILGAVASGEPLEIREAAPVSDEKLEAAAEALIAAWPARSRHYAGMALCGGLARLGWSEGAIVDFVGFVMFRTVGSAEEAKWTAQARDVHDKLHRGENVTGFHALEDLMCTGADGSVDEGRRELVRSAIKTARAALEGNPAELFGIAREQSRPRTVQEELAIAITETLPAGVARPRFLELLDEAASSILPAVKEAAIKRDEKPTDTDRWGHSKRRIRATHTPPPRYLVQELIISGGAQAIAGEAKSGKSWDLAHITVALAAGVAVYGRFAVQAPVGTFTFAIEDTMGSMDVRTDAIAAGLKLDPNGDWIDRWYAQPRGKSLNVMNDWHLCILAASVWLCEEEMAAAGKPGRIQLIGIDPLSDSHDGQEDKRDSMAPVMNRLRAFAGAMSKRGGADVALLFVHHTGKENKETRGRKRGGQKMRGSSVIHGAVDGGLYLDNLRGDGRNEFIARMESELKAARSAGYFDRKLTIEDDENGNARTATFTTAECATSEADPQDLADQRAFGIVKKLWGAGDTLQLTYKELHKSVGGKDAIFRRAIELAEYEGWIEQRYRGMRSIGYAITEAGRELVRNGGSRETAPAPNS